MSASILSPRDSVVERSGRTGEGWQLRPSRRREASGPPSLSTLRNPKPPCTLIDKLQLSILGLTGKGMVLLVAEEVAVEEVLEEERGELPPLRKGYQVVYLLVSAALVCSLGLQLGGLTLGVVSQGPSPSSRLN